MALKYKPCHDVGTIVHIAIDQKYVGHILISDKIQNLMLKKLSQD